MTPKRIAIVVGTRPEAIKMAPIVLEARKYPHLDVMLVATGQQDALFNAAIADFGIAPDAHLGISAGASVDVLEAQIMARLKQDQPDTVLVQGDTNTALAGAQAAHALGIVVGHVEAGLRTHDPARPFPEENNRVAIAQLATLHFAPSSLAAENLGAEQVPGEIHVTGNPGIDALMMARARLKPLPKPTKPHILITCHRRENFLAPLQRIIQAVRTLAQHSNVHITVPVHPNPAVREPLSTQLGAVPNISLVEPLDYPHLIRSLLSSRFVLSDSGGLQEECAALGVPMLCLREETERRELVEAGNVRLVGSDADLIIAEAVRLLGDDHHHAAMSVPSFPYGRGDAAGKIVAILAS